MFFEPTRRLAFSKFLFVQQPPKKWYSFGSSRLSVMFPLTPFLLAQFQAHVSAHDPKPAASHAHLHHTKHPVEKGLPHKSHLDVEKKTIDHHSTHPVVIAERERVRERNGFYHWMADIFFFFLRQTQDAQLGNHWEQNESFCTSRSTRSHFTMSLFWLGHPGGLRLLFASVCKRFVQLVAHDHSTSE